MVDIRIFGHLISRWRGASESATDQPPRQVAECAASMLTSVIFVTQVFWVFDLLTFSSALVLSQTNLLDTTMSGETFDVVRSRIEVRCIEPRRKSAALGGRLARISKPTPQMPPFVRKL